MNTVEASCDSVSGIVHYMTVRQRIRNSLLNPAWVCFLWVGMTIGVSMIATPARFTAESITRAVALDVGRVVFAALNRVEFVALVLLLIIVRLSGSARRLWPYCAALALIVLLQGAWLMPELAARTEIILAGGEPSASYAHAFYSSLELIKIGVLLFVGFSNLD